MSVQTTADDHLDQLKERIDGAINNTAAIVVSEEWGWDSYSKEYLQMLRDVLKELLEMRVRLRG